MYTKGVRRGKRREVYEVGVEGGERTAWGEGGEKVSLSHMV